MIKQALPKRFITEFLIWQTENLFGKGSIKKAIEINNNRRVLKPRKPNNQTRLHLIKRFDN